jgi:hypothetical protein
VKRRRSRLSFSATRTSAGRVAIVRSGRIRKGIGETTMVGRDCECASRRILVCVKANFIVIGAFLCGCALLSLLGHPRVPCLPVSGPLVPDLFGSPSLGAGQTTSLRVPAMYKRRPGWPSPLASSVARLELSSGGPCTNPLRAFPHRPRGHLVDLPYPLLSSCSLWLT